MNPISTATLAIPVFDADNHLYETKDAFTKFLPERYKGAVDYVDVRGRTKIVIKGTISDYIPNPTFDVVAAPGAMEEYFRLGNPDGPFGLRPAWMFKRLARNDGAKLKNTVDKVATAAAA